MSTNFLTRSRHNSIYYFRRRIPKDISHIFKNNLLLKSLSTSSKRIAVVLARNLASQTDNLFEEIRIMNKKTGNNPLASLILNVDINSRGELTAFTVDAQPHEAEAAQKIITTLLTHNTTNNTTAPLHAQLNAPISPAMDFQGYIDEYLKKAGLKANTIANYKSKLEFAKKFFGAETNLLEITQLNFVQLAEHVKSQIKNTTTQSLYIQVVVSFINWHLIRNGKPKLTSETLIPKRKTPEHHDRDAFSLDDMRIIIVNAFKYSNRQPYKWWSTLAVAFSGCRIEEICQVNLDTDLIHDSENNIWYFSFDENSEIDGSTKKSIKKLTSWRKMPIHSVLVKMGFIDYLKAQKRKGFNRPFEAGWSPRTVEKDNICKWSQYATKWGGRELTKLADKGLLERDGKTYFHSMRHTVAKLMLEAGVSSDISEALAGRSAGAGEQERYGKIKNNYVLLSRDGIEKALNPLVEIIESVIKK
jgi:integrase